MQVLLAVTGILGYVFGSVDHVLGREGVDAGNNFGVAQRPVMIVLCIFIVSRKALLSGGRR